MRLSISITAIPGLLPVIALIFLFLALPDIADGEQDLVPEWCIAGTSIIILSTFAASNFFTLVYLLKSSVFCENGHAIDLFYSS